MSITMDKIIEEMTARHPDCVAKQTCANLRSLWPCRGIICELAKTSKRNAALNEHQEKMG